MSSNLSKHSFSCFSRMKCVPDRVSPRAERTPSGVLGTSSADLAASPAGVGLSAFLEASSAPRAAMPAQAVSVSASATAPHPDPGRLNMAFSPNQVTCDLPAASQPKKGGPSTRPKGGIRGREVVVPERPALAELAGRQCFSVTLHHL